MEKEKAEIASLVTRYDRVQSLMKYVNSDTLKESYRKQPKGKAVGMDEITKEQYGENLDENIENLLIRMKKFSYRPYPVRRVLIPKGNGKMRKLGIPSFEDKVVQGVFKEILEAIYEPKFKEFSFGFRPNKSCHDAIQRVNKHIMADKVNYILDADIKGFFDNVNHGKLLKQMWTLGIRDKKLLSIISAMMKAEVAGIGFPEKGTPQGGIISPLLSNIVLNELDWWIVSQWEEMPTQRNYVHRIYANGTRSEAPLLSGTKIMTASSSSTARTRWCTLRRRFPSCWKTSQSP